MEGLWVWLALGFVGFWLARAAWQLEFGCAPVTVGTLIGAAASSALGVVTLLAAAVWLLAWVCSKRSDNLLSRVLRFEIANPCKWKRAEPQ